jgi:Heterokaryon incompatibility protein (HET)
MNLVSHAMNQFLACWGRTQSFRKTFSATRLGEEYRSRQMWTKCYDICVSRLPCSHLWVNAICLNQLDLTEKAIQVPLMGDIYFVPGLSVANAGVMRHHAAFKNSLNILYTIRLLQSQLYIALSYYVQAL